MSPIIIPGMPDVPPWQPGDHIPETWHTRRASGMTYVEWLKLTGRWADGKFISESHRRILEGID
ncbi:MAG: hypothetical protein KAS32_20100 [Candidatus Peribacteraceae bacterium]|nr:hypothetical protein [Candidatus Peribacteraceae bacterium]